MFRLPRAYADSPKAASLFVAIRAPRLHVSALRCDAEATADMPRRHELRTLRT